MNKSEQDVKSGIKHRKIPRHLDSFINPIEDDSTFYASDDTYGFLATGRDFQPAGVSHRYTTNEKETLSMYDSLDYLPSHSLVYKNWLRRQKWLRYQSKCWVMMGLIGFFVGQIGFLMHQLIEKIAELKWETTKQFLMEEKYIVAWAWALCYTVGFVLFSAGSVVFLRTSAGGSGIPEVTGFLNGTLVRHVFNVKTMAVKFFSCVCAVGSGMPVGPEGPMIHLGALVGAGVSQFKSETLKINLPFFEEFRNSENRRNFISAGVAAGVASAFGSPVGGLLFSMEEVSSFWTTTLSWQIFFCCMMSTFTTDLFNSAFFGFEYRGSFGQFKKERYILFNIDHGIDVNVLMFLPTILIGSFGGLLGAFFTFLSLKMTKMRKRALAKVKVTWIQKIIRLLEPVFLMIIVTSITIFLPAVFSCTEFTCSQDKVGQIRQGCLNNTVNNLHVEPSVTRYTCPEGVSWQENHMWLTNGSYNELASLLFLTGEDAVKHLFSRETHFQFGYSALLISIPYYFFMVCWASGTSVSSGILVPMLFIGGLYGRLLGIMMVSILRAAGSNDSALWSWIDPGAFALIGAASFFGGVTRLTMAVTVIMLEMTNDVQFLLPIMVAIMVSKWVGDYFTHPHYHSLLELKCIPFLSSEPKVVIDKQRINIDLFMAKDVMASPVITIQTKELVSVISNLLLNTTHGGFPVVKKFGQAEEHFYGMITRFELYTLMKMSELFEAAGTVSFIKNNHNITWVDYTQLTMDKLSDPQSMIDLLQSYITESKYKDQYIDLNPYINQSAFCIPKSYSLYRTYILFRSLGLRHLVVTDFKNHILGIITRKDLMGFSMEEKLCSTIKKRLSESHVTEERVRTASETV